MTIKDRGYGPRVSVRRDGLGLKHLFFNKRLNMDTDSIPTVVTTTVPTTETETPLYRRDLVAIVNALLLFAAEHCYRVHKPRINVTWQSRDIIKEVAFFWTLEKYSRHPELDLCDWSDQCDGLRQHLSPRYEALAIHLNDASTESRTVITRVNNTDDWKDNSTTTVPGRLDATDLVCKINRVFDFVARFCETECEPELQVLWTGHRAKKRILLFWYLKHVNYADDEYYHTHTKAYWLRECLNPDFSARVSYNDDVTEARASITNNLAIEDLRIEE